MGEAVHKWLGGVAAGLSMAAIVAIFAMWNSINRLEAERPLRDQIRTLETEQTRQGIQLNSNQLDVMAMELSSLEARVRTLENGQ